MAHEELRSKASAQADAERRLIEDAQKDPRLFGDLYENNFHRVFVFIMRRVRDRNEAEDLTSEVFHQALAGLPRFEWRGVPFAAWLFKIASNAIIDRAKRAAKEQGISNTLDPPADVTPHEFEDQIEERVRLFQLVDRLPAHQRLVIGMRFAEEKSIREIALALGRSEGAVKQLQFRALQNLRARLNDESGDMND
jgi:RNA polymerase sigma-70 factor (ECF subfamily)